MTMISPCQGPVRLSRRELLQIGTIGIWGLALPDVLRAAARNTRLGQAPKADSCILIFLNGGPSHLDMWDMKPAAPAEIRGQFKPIATTVPGIQVSEHLPRLARWMHRCTLVRSVHHSVNNSHAAAVYVGLTGHDRGELGGGAKPTDYPAIGSVVGMLRPPPNMVMPFVSMPYITAEGAGGPPQPGFFGGWLGRSCDPLFVLRDPNASGFGMPELAPAPDVSPSRIEARKRLASCVGASQGDWAMQAPPQDMGMFQSKAFDLLTSPAAQKAFQLEREPLPVREAYGRNIYGQSVLLARRLIEAGTRVACISWAPDANATWDTHGGNFTKLKGTLLPQLDAAVSSLLNDLVERGLLKRTLVVVMGEFGRSPKVNRDAGRDHWNFCYSLLLAGGGLKSGTIHGASDKIGARPSQCPATPADIVATIYDRLGIPANLELHDRQHRPYQLVPWGNPIREILA
ncbi:MAG TPA: DUF1501 domain-containing protein [Gemmataceae bacterium]|nr:DUF1501 domain-containing protein [Gemmataceae bacterium]